MASRLINVASEPRLAIDPQDAAAEANHRIANNLTIIAEYVRSELSSLSPEKIPDFASIRRSLQQLALRIDAIGRLHRLLTNAPSAAKVEICSYLREIADAVRCSLARAERINTLFFFETEALVSSQQAVAIGAIASEALVNSINTPIRMMKPASSALAARERDAAGSSSKLKTMASGGRLRFWTKERATAAPAPV
jgi:hypothetical protein